MAMRAWWTLALLGVWACGADAQTSECGGADLDGSGAVSTDDLLFLLSRFGRQCSDAATAACPPPPPPAPPCPPADCSAEVEAAVASWQQTASDAQAAQAECASATPVLVAEALAAAAENCTQTRQADQAYMDAELADRASAYDTAIGQLRADLEGQLSAAQTSLTATQASLTNCESQLTLVRCYGGPIQHATVSGSGSFVSVGDTVDYTCNTGYSTGDGTTTQQTSTCQDNGLLNPLPPACTVVDPCSLETDDCDTNAACAMTGAGEHSCECNAGFFGTGQACSVCHVCPVGFSIQTPCTTTTDTVCVDDCAAVTCGAYGTCSLGSCVCTGSSILLRIPVDCHCVNSNPTGFCDRRRLDWELL